jgi:hypothetical protein
MEREMIGRTVDLRFQMVQPVKSLFVEISGKVSFFRERHGKIQDLGAGDASMQDERSVHVALANDDGVGLLFDSPRGQPSSTTDRVAKEE